MCLGSESARSDACGGCGPEKWWEGIKEGSVLGFFFFSNLRERDSSISFSNGTPH